MEMWEYILEALLSFRYVRSKPKGIIPRSNIALYFSNPKVVRNTRNSCINSYFHYLEKKIFDVSEFLFLRIIKDIYMVYFLKV